VGNTADTLVIKMKDLGLDYIKEGVRFGSMSLVYDQNDKKILVADEVDLKVRKSDNGLVSLSIRKEANGHNTLVARERAKNILFGHSFVDNEIVLDEYLSTDVSNKARNQEVTATIHIPEGRVLRFEESTKYRIGRGIKNDRNYYRTGLVGHLWVMGQDGELKCQDCPEEKKKEESDRNKILINEDGVDIDIRDRKDSFEMKIDKDGIKVKTGEDKHN